MTKEKKDRLSSGNKLKTIIWGFKTCWKIDKWTMVFWGLLSGLIAVLPAVALHFNRESLAVISGFLSGEAYTYADAVRPIVSLGLLMIAIGLSARVNGDLVYMMMYDKYYIGTCHLIMDNIQRIDMTDLLKKGHQRCMEFQLSACRLHNRLPRWCMHHTKQDNFHRISACCGIYYVEADFRCGNSVHHRCVRNEFFIHGQDTRR